MKRNLASILVVLMLGMLLFQVASASDKTACPNCQFENTIENKFCNKCGTILEEWALSGTIIRVDGKKLLIDKGTVDRISRGDVFELIKERERIVHPQTGKYLGTDVVVKAVVRVVSNEDNLSWMLVGDRFAEFKMEPGSAILLRKVEDPRQYYYCTSRFYIAPVFGLLSYVQGSEVASRHKLDMSSTSIMGGTVGVDLLRHFTLEYSVIGYMGTVRFLMEYPDNHPLYEPQESNDAQYNSLRLAFRLSRRKLAPFAVISIGSVTDRFLFSKESTIGIGSGITIPVFRYLAVALSAEIHRPMENSEFTFLRLRVAPQIMITRW